MTGVPVTPARRPGRVSTGLLWLAVIHLTLPGALAAQPERIRARPPVALDVAVENGADVWSRADGTGYANDVVRAAFRAGGVEPHLIVVPYSRCKAMVIAAVVPACVSMSHDRSIPPSIVFADSANFTFQSDFYQNVDHPLAGGADGQLARGTVVGVVRGYEYPDTIRRLAARGVIRLVAASSEVVNLRKLADGRLDAVMLNTDEIKRGDDLIARAGVAERVAFASHGGSLPAFIGFNVRHPRGAEALARYNAGRRLIAQNGELADIKRRWADSIRVAPRASRAVPAHP